MGGRATGTAAVVHLVETAPAGSSIIVVDPDDRDYPSVFDDEDPLLLANSSPGINSLFPDRPDDFLDFLGGERPTATPRFVMGRYYRDRYRAACRRAAARGCAVERVSAACRRITADGDGYHAVLSDGRRLPVDAAVIAVGAGPLRRVPGLRGLPPFPSRRLRTNPQPRRALVVGQGQSGIDAALVLCDAGSEVVMTSRSGEFPAVRTRTLPAEVDLGTIDLPADVYRLLDRDTRSKGHPPLAEQLSRAADPFDRLREETKLAEADACPWQDSVIGILDVLCDRALPVAKDKFLWRYVTAIALPTAHRMLEHIERGALGVADFGSVDPAGFDLVVTATGFDPPPLHARRRTLYLTAPPHDAHAVTQLDASFRMVLSPGHGPERIWAIGPASGLRVPFANFFRAATFQARDVARQIAALTAPAEGGDRAHP
ncbi:FAD/NAD(P)-binding protein [Actinocorallia sp. A-T 12471]|uniref:FAD/NAD(P)-binding protein n=1 Tax=Actinocorallia sp. A-T 12471 TaxID=3089813 RepID=UPI0029CD899D|nr:FAD/NAD(P)-binding protein [Actinocorallia sp. A-T 12471]MDX6741524.1 FAD/NAD(P)-binding protein [Actinocorallia sp. A-T 12471]